MLTALQRERVLGSLPHVEVGTLHGIVHDPISVTNPTLRMSNRLPSLAVGTDPWAMHDPHFLVSVQPVPLHLSWCIIKHTHRFSESHVHAQS